jgi:hypothetical protein
MQTTCDDEAGGSGPGLAWMRPGMSELARARLEQVKQMNPGQLKQRRPSAVQCR